MLNTPTKSHHWKGQSRVQKCCHWCTKKEESQSKPFQACARCKEVIYCSKECQVASWPHHKTACSLNSENKAALHGANADVAKSVAAFKKWHGSHVAALRHAIICALDLAKYPEKVDRNVVFCELQLRPNHENLPPNEKYSPVKGCIFTTKETLELFGPLGGASIVESTRQNSVFMQAKGSMGVGLIILKAHGFCDAVKVTLPSRAAVKAAQEADNWGNSWVDHLRIATF